MIFQNLEALCLKQRMICYTQRVLSRSMINTSISFESFQYKKKTESVGRDPRLCNNAEVTMSDLWTGLLLDSQEFVSRVVHR